MRSQTLEGEPDLQPVSHEELNRRIRSLDLGAADSDSPSGDEPCWIDPGELIRRVAPWISQN